jgi:hypothetical protein
LLFLPSVRETVRETVWDIVQGKYLKLSDGNILEQENNCIQDKFTRQAYWYGYFKKQMVNHVKSTKA